MPSGGGGFGGGGGGGGFSGGGWGGGGYYHTHHHYHGRGGRHRRKSTPMEKLTYTLLLGLLIILVIMITLMIHYTKNVNKGGNTYYSPGDSRLIELNTLFCKKITLTETSTLTDAELYLLTADEIPLITDRNNFTIQSDFSIQSNNYQYWQYHLYPNSNVTISACVFSGSSATLYVIKGTSNFNDWTETGSSSNTYQNVFVSQLCSTNDNANLILTITSDDEWYFAFANLGSGTTQISAELDLERFQYTTSTLGNVSSRCSATASDDCSLDVKFRSSRKYALIVTSIPEANVVDWSENVDVDWNCARNHGGYFLVIGVPIFGLIFIILLGVGVVLLGLFCIKYKSEITSTFSGRMNIISTTTSSSNTSSPPAASAMASTSFNNQQTGEEIPEEVLKAESVTRTEPPPAYMNNPPPSYSETYS